MKFIFCHVTFQRRRIFLPGCYRWPPHPYSNVYIKNFCCSCQNKPEATINLPAFIAINITATAISLHRDLKWCLIPCLTFLLVLHFSIKKLKWGIRNHFNPRYSSGCHFNGHKRRESYCSSGPNLKQVKIIVSLKFKINLIFCFV